ncbi:uncharacterized protein LOC122663179 [Telopea speciosissima]|uniref:uncharacterized protein LOC122663179 n=1 Tax=Telopea speciosissima TaxID=54955 RepID=UPI001CC7A4A4|nr:uncharacterized protein LOC122663179 [Telopea speciosissima]
MICILSDCASTDSWYWGPSKNGKFSVKSVYYLALNSNIVKNRSDCASASNSLFYKQLWKLDILLKMKLFLWRCCVNACCVNQLLFTTSITHNAKCLICQLDEKSIVHALFRCSFASSCWLASPFRLDTSSFQGNDFKDWICFLFDKYRDAPDQRDCYIQWPSLLWQIWKTRNKVVFIFENPNLTATIKAFNHTVEEGRLGISRFPNPHLPDNNPSSYCLSFDFSLHVSSPTLILAFTDGVWNNKSMKGGRGVILFNGVKRFIAAKCKAGSSFPAASMEAESVRDALLLASSLGFSNLVLFSDCQALVSSLNGISSSLDWAALSIMEDILSISSSFINIEFRFILRSLNKEAHFLAT